MTWARAAISFLVVFVLSFVLGGYFLMPHLPPYPDHPVTIFELDYWMDNWAGAVLGILLGGASAWSILRAAKSTTARPAKP